MSVCVLVCASMCVCAVVAQDFSIGSDIPDSICKDETLEKESDENTMEYMDNLKVSNCMYEHIGAISVYCPRTCLIPIRDFNPVI